MQHCRRKLNVERAHITQNTVQYGEALVQQLMEQGEVLVQQLMEWANQSSERAAELLLAEIEAESLAVSKQKWKAKKGKGRAMATKEPGGVSLVTNSAMMAGKASQSRTGVSGASGDEAGAPSGACSSTQGAPRTMLHLAADMHQSHDTKQMVKESFAMAICEEAQVDTSSVSTELDTNTSAREALQATAATGDVEALCSAIEEHLGVADSTNLAEARAARSTLRKRKKREEKAQAKAAQARQALASADDISSLESALRITAGLPADELAAAHYKLDALKRAEARAIAKARMIEEVDAHIEKLQVVASYEGGKVSAEDGQWVVCLDAGQTHAFVPCGHICCCGECCDRIMNSASKVCLLCRQPCIWGGRMYKG